MLIEVSAWQNPEDTLGCGNNVKKKARVAHQLLGSTARRERDRPEDVAECAKQGQWTTQSSKMIGLYSVGIAGVRTLG